MNVNLKTITLDNVLPPYPDFEPGIRRAPDRGYSLDNSQTAIALKNALRYVPNALHKTLAPEFLDELRTRGKIYAYRFRPEGRIYGRPISEYKSNCIEGKAFQVNLDNNLDFETALYPYELITYGETGSVCQNWMQYLLIKKYLEAMTSNQTLVIESGHPLGLFPSRPESPRVIITNGLMIGMYDNPADFRIAEQMGVANYGQMTAGGWMYIGPQGIVHGTYNTLINAGRIKLGRDSLGGTLFVSSGLGGMSGAQPKAVEIAGGVGIIAEVDYSRIQTRHSQGWIGSVTDDPAAAFKLAIDYAAAKKPASIAFYGNIVDLLRYAVNENIHIDLLSDQTSCHIAYDGGYCPQGLTFSEFRKMQDSDRTGLKALINKSLQIHYECIKTLVERGTYFFDYGNAFLKTLYDSGIKEISRNGKDDRDGFIYPSYVEDIMGPELFDRGYGPFRWVCLSGDPEDLRKTDEAALGCIGDSPQDRDNYYWIKNAGAHKLVVGTQARILYQDAEGRVRIALKFNEMVRNGEIGPVMLGRDHHDTGGTDSPFRETANIRDGSNIMADMSTQCFAGNAARGMSLVALHNGGGVGIGKSVNGGFGLVLDGSERIDIIISSALSWDVMSGVARRAWAGNENSLEVVAGYNNGEGRYITVPYIADEDFIKSVIQH